jgi:hypothetical protein
LENQFPGLSIYAKNGFTPGPPIPIPLGPLVGKSIHAPPEKGENLIPATFNVFDIVVFVIIVLDTVRFVNNRLDKLREPIVKFVKLAFKPFIELDDIFPFIRRDPPVILMAFKLPTDIFNELIVVLVITDAFKLVVVNEVITPDTTFSDPEVIPVEFKVEVVIFVVLMFGTLNEATVKLPILAFNEFRELDDIFPFIRRDPPVILMAFKLPELIVVTFKVELVIFVVLIFGTLNEATVKLKVVKLEIEPELAFTFPPIFTSF